MTLTKLPMSHTGWFPSEMTTGSSGDNNESTPQEDPLFQQEMERIGARVPPGRMGNAKDLASVRFIRRISLYRLFFADGGYDARLY